MSILGTNFETWISEVQARVMPSNLMLTTRAFVREYAEGCLANFWSPSAYSRLGGWFGVLQGYNNRLTSGEADLEDEGNFLARYVRSRWSENGLLPPDISTLTSLGYVSKTKDLHGSEWISFTDKAFELLEDTKSAVTRDRIFISYSRKESSAFALLILARLKATDFEAFLDMSMIPGENWHQGIQNRIEESDIFVSVIGKNTLRSSIILDELQWAINAKKTIIPIWHNGFVFSEQAWIDMPAEIKSKIGLTHAIQVYNESAAGYNNAIVELLNRFGVTP